MLTQVQPLGPGPNDFWRRSCSRIRDLLASPHHWGLKCRPLTAAVKSASGTVVLMRRQRFKVVLVAHPVFPSLRLASVDRCAPAASQCLACTAPISRFANALTPCPQQILVRRNNFASGPRSISRCPHDDRDYPGPGKLRRVGTRWPRSAPEPHSREQKMLV